MLCKDRRPACMRPATGLFGWARALWVRAQSRAAACPTRGCPLGARGRARRRQQGWPDRRAGANPVPKPRRGQPGQRPARVLQPDAGRPRGGRQVHEALRAAAAGHGRCAPAPRPPWSRHFGLPPLSAARGAVGRARRARARRFSRMRAAARPHLFLFLNVSHARHFYGRPSERAKEPARRRRRLHQEQRGALLGERDGRAGRARRARGAAGQHVPGVLRPGPPAQPARAQGHGQRQRARRAGAHPARGSRKPAAPRARAQCAARPLCPPRARRAAAPPRARAPLQTAGMLGLWAGARGVAGGLRSRASLPRARPKPARQRRRVPGPAWRPPQVRGLSHADHMHTSRDRQSRGRARSRVLLGTQHAGGSRPCTRAVSGVYVYTHTNYAYDTARQLASHTGVKLSRGGANAP